MFLNRLQGSTVRRCDQLACLHVHERQRDNSLVSDALSCGLIAREPLVRSQVLHTPPVQLSVPWSTSSFQHYVFIVVERSAA